MAILGAVVGRSSAPAALQPAMAGGLFTYATVEATGPSLVSRTVRVSHYSWDSL